MAVGFPVFRSSDGLATVQADQEFRTFHSKTPWLAFFYPVVGHQKDPPIFFKIVPYDVVFSETIPV